MAELPGPLRILDIQVVFTSDGKILATGGAHYGKRFCQGIDLGEAWYQLGPEDKEADGTVSRDRLGIIIQDLIDPFGWQAIDIEREGQH